MPYCLTAEYDDIEQDLEVNTMDDNIWEYPFGDIEDDDDMFYSRPDHPQTESRVPAGRAPIERPSSGCALL